MLRKTIQHIPLRMLLIIPFILQISFVTGLVGYWSWKNGQAAVNNVATQLREEVSQSVIKTLRNYLNTPVRLNTLHHHSLQSTQLDLDDPQNRTRYFWTQLKSFPTISNSFVGTQDEQLFGARRIDEDIQLTEKTSAHEGALNYFSANEQAQKITVTQTINEYKVAQRPWFKAAVEAAKPTWSQVYTDVGGRGLAITAVRPEYDAQGVLQAVFGSALLLQWIQDFLQTVRIGHSGQAFLMEPSGLLIANSQNSRIFRDDNPKYRLLATESENPLIAQSALILEKRLRRFDNLRYSQKFDFEFQGARYFLQASPVKDTQGLSWILAVVVAENEFMQQIQNNNRLTLLFIALALALSLIFGIFTSRWISRPLLDLNIAATQLAAGRWWIQPTHNLQNRNDEIGQLSRAFNQMSEQLADSFTQMEEKVNHRTQSLAETNTQLVRLNQEKNEFLGIAAHDLKNPLSAIKGLSEEISESYDEMTQEEVVDYAVQIRKASHKMFQLITNLLDVNAIESGKINADVKQQDILPVITAVFNTYANRAANKHIKATFIHDESTYDAFVDDNIVHQVLDNLISNAVKYSPENTCFSVTVRNVNNRTGQWIRCEVADQGLGLSEADQDKLFGKFTRLTPQPTGDEHSTGLGLFIVKKLVLALNGQVWCESTLGEGACFIVQWPAQEDVNSTVNLSESIT